MPTECLENLVGSVLLTTQIAFSEEELNPDGTRHVKALHIIMRCQEINVAKVLINNVPLGMPIR